MVKLSQRLRTLAATALFAVGAVAATSAVAAPVFTVDPNSNGFATQGTIFNADQMHGFSSAQLVATGGNTYSGVGYIVFDGFALNNSTVGGQFSRVNFDYGLYATFNQTFLCSGALAPGVSCGVTSISLNLYGDAGNDNTYNAASLASAASVTTNGAQVLLGSVTNVLSGLSGLDALGGAFQNVNTNFSLTNEGKAYFIAPVPFYQFAFSAFNNTSQGVACNTAGCVGATVFAITQESGITDFNRVPEPGPLSLFGIGLLGMLAYRRKSRA